MSNTLVVDTSLQAQQQAADFAVLGFRSVLPTSTITGQAEDPLFPFSNALDFRDNTKYSPLATSTTIVIQFDQAAPTDIDYFAFAIHNSQDAGLTGKLEVDVAGVFETVAEFTSIKNNRPFLKFFGTKNSQRQKLTLTFTSKLFIGAIYIGEAVVFNRTPSLGFQPGRTSPLDKVEQFRTDGNNFLIGRRINKGFQEKPTFRFVLFDDLDVFFDEMINHILNSKPMFFKWSNTKDQTMFALQNVEALPKPTYVTSFHSDLAFELNGYS